MRANLVCIGHPSSDGDQVRKGSQVAPIGHHNETRDTP